MDKPTTSSGPNASWPEDPGSGQGLGATGIFGTVNEPKPGEERANSAAEPDPLDKWLSDPPKPQPAAPAPLPATRDFAEPVVHKVVFGGGAAENSPQLLDRMRQASAERAAAESPASADPGSKGTGGFTELLRTLNEPAAPAAVPTPAPRVAQNSGFTSLLGTLGTPEPLGAEYKPAPQSSPAPGGLTELLRATSADAPGFPSPNAQSPAWGEPVANAPLPGESKPGAFTQMFGAFGGGNPPEPVSPPQSSAGSFTKMLSLEQEPAPAAPVFQEERRPLPGPIDYGQVQRNESPAPNRDPFAVAPLQETTPPQSMPGGSGMGITRLIQMLDEPSKTPPPTFEPAPMTPPPAPEPGVWTQTFASLSKSTDFSSPPAKAPAPSPSPPAYPPAPPMVEPIVNKPVAAAAAGPSEFTRILDASRIRELSMKGGAAAPATQSAQAQSFTPIPPPMPSFQMPPAPPMQIPGDMPQAGGFTPPQAPQVPSYPMSYGPQVGMSQMGGGMPQAPGMQMPTVPAPPVPQVPQVKAPDPGTGKTQQMLVIMGVVIIVLLVAILVTEIFLMKH